MTVKEAKFQFKESIKNLKDHVEERDDLLRRIMNSKVSSWGAFKLTVIKY